MSQSVLKHKKTQRYLKMKRGSGFSSINSNCKIGNMKMCPVLCINKCCKINSQLFCVFLNLIETFQSQLMKPLLIY